MNELFEAQGQYGDVSAMQQLSREAPISGAPLPGEATTARAVVPTAPGPVGPGVMAQPYTPSPPGVQYYQGLAKAWGKLARLPGTGPAVQAHATAARGYARKVEKGHV